MSENVMWAEYEEEVRQEEGFRILNDQAAMWAVDECRKADEECDRWTAWYEQKIAEAKARRDAIKARMKGYLQDYAETLPMRETKTQRSYQLPGAKLIYRKASTKLEHDDAVLLQTLKDQGREEYIKTVITEKVDWAGLKKELQETGEVIEGVTLVDVPESFEVKVGGV